MIQYLELLKAIQEKGTYKPPAREGMPGTQSLFGYQFRHNLADGFPLLTTKKVYWKGIVTELLWFLRGDTNIKYLVDNNVNIWNEDAFNYYLKVQGGLTKTRYDFESFVNVVKTSNKEELLTKSKILGLDNYILGDCGYQYGKVWREWHNLKTVYNGSGSVHEPEYIEVYKPIDQIKNVINSLKNNPESRRHIITAIDPAHDADLALYWCHAMFQFNCRPIDLNDLTIWCDEHPFAQENEIPKYYLDCQLYQRSADVFLGVPYNIASYALLIHIISKICNTIPGEFIHSFGDVHIYDNHKEAVEIQLQREPGVLPTLQIKDEGNDWAAISNLDFNLIDMLEPSDFILENYDPQPAIKAKLSTGLK